MGYVVKLRTIGQRLRLQRSAAHHTRVSTLSRTHPRRKRPFIRCLQTERYVRLHLVFRAGRCRRFLRAPQNRPLESPRPRQLHPRTLFLRGTAIWAQRAAPLPGFVRLFALLFFSVSLSLCVSVLGFCSCLSFFIPLFLC